MLLLDLGLPNLCFEWLAGQCYSGMLRLFHKNGFQSKSGPKNIESKYRLDSLSHFQVNMK